MKSTELQKINRENENSESEALNILIFQCSLDMWHVSRAFISWQPEANPLQESENEPACSVLFGTDPPASPELAWRRTTERQRNLALKWSPYQ
jgi:hypothetical protein